MNEQLLSLAKTLNSRGFRADAFENSQQAVEFIQQLIMEYGKCTKRWDLIRSKSNSTFRN